jgi:hypothetical protein
MTSIRFWVSALLVASTPLAAPSLHAQISPEVTRADTTGKSDTAGTSAAPTDDDGVPLGLQFGIASGALHYHQGRSEQSLAAMIRWAPLRWFSLAATPAGVRASTPAIAGVAPASHSGLTDLPIEATLSHTLHARMAPTISGGVALTLPLGDTASGFGTGKVGYSASAGFGFSPAERVWMQFGAGRSFSGFSVQSAFTGASGWGDASAGFSLTDRLSVSGGYSADLGSIDTTMSRSTSVNGGLAVALHGPLTLNVLASHGVSGAAPSWSFVMGVGTVFPYLGHLDAGSAIAQLRSTFGGGSHGLGGTIGSGTSSGRGGRKW